MRVGNVESGHFARIDKETCKTGARMNEIQLELKMGESVLVNRSIEHSLRVALGR